MSRTANAVIATSFGYLRYVLAIVSGFVVLPLTLAKVETADYGEWLIALEVLGYLAFTQLGVLELLPWLVAQSDGRKDRIGLIRLVNDARGFCILSSVVYLIAFAAIYTFAPRWIGLQDGLTSRLGLSVVVVSSAAVIGMFGNIHLGVLQGLQDFKFLGALMVVQWFAGVVITVTLLVLGAGTLALAAGLTAPAFIASFASTIRLYVRDRDVVVNWIIPSWSGIKYLTINAGGTFVGGIGGKLVIGSNSLLIAAAGGSSREVVVFFCTAKLCDMLLMQVRQVIDGGLIGLAQLHGEGNRDRVLQIASLMTRFAMLGSGLSIIVILGFNRAFVLIWLGPDRFGGVWLNAAIAVTLLGLSLTHVLSVTVSVVGGRVAVGLTNLMHGLSYAGLAIALGAILGPTGIGVAGGLAAFTVGIPVLWKVQRLVIGQSLRDTFSMLSGIFLPRAIVPIVAASCLGMSEYGDRWEVCLPSTFLLGAGYIWLMRPLFAGIPLPRRLQVLTRRLKTTPGATS